MLNTGSEGNTSWSDGNDFCSTQRVEYFLGRPKEVGESLAIVAVTDGPDSELSVTDLALQLAAATADGVTAQPNSSCWGSARRNARPEIQ